MHSPRRTLLALITLALLPVLGCNLVANLGQADDATATSVALQPTATTLALATPPAPDATLPPSEPAATPDPSSTPEPGPTAGPGISRIVIARGGGRLSSIDLQGQSVPFATLPDQGEAGSNAIVRAIPAGDTLYLHVGYLEPRFLAAAPDGLRTLDFIHATAGTIASFAVWPAAEAQLGRVAWTVTGPNDSVRLVSSRLDGSERQLLAETTYDPQTSMDASWHALHWSQDGNTLYFSRQPDGLGGIILFGGYTSLWAYDFSGDQVRPIQEGAPCGNPLGLEPLSPSGQWLPDQCGQQLHMTNLQTGARLEVSPPPEVGEIGQFGGVVYSPDARRFAYAMELGVSSGAFTVDPSVVQGWVAAADLGAAGSRLVIDSPPGSYFVVKAWLPGDILVLEQDNLIQPGRSVWTVNVDGSQLQKLADGQFVAVLTQP